MEGVFIIETIEGNRIESECVFQVIKPNKREKHIIKYRTEINVDNIYLYKNVRLTVNYQGCKSFFNFVYLSESKLPYIIETAKKQIDTTIRAASYVDKGTLEHIIITIV